MNWFFRDRRRATRHWTLAGLLLVLAFLGHDLLMAGPARAATTPAPASQHQALSHFASHPGPADMAPFSPGPNHPQDCGIGQWAAPRAGAAPEVMPTELTPRGVSDAISALHLAAAPPWQEPGCSAANRRAFLQVYRI